MTVSNGDTTGSDNATWELAARARALGPLLAAHAEEGETARRVPEASIQALRDAGVFKTMVPKRYGGYEGSMRSLLEVGSAVAEGDGGAGWVATLTGIAAWMTGLFSGKAQDEVFGADPDAIICGSGSPLGRSVKVDGGWRVSGTWPYISGSLHANWATLGFLATDDAGEVVSTASALVPIRECQLTDTWFMTGMRASGSNTLALYEVFVPEHRVLFSVPGSVGSYATEYHDEVAYRAALYPSLTLVLVAPLLGVGRAALEFVRKAAASKPIIATTYARQADSATFQLTLAQAATRIDTAHLHAFRAAQDIDDHAARAVHPEDRTRARIRADAAHAAQEVVAALSTLASIHGSSGYAEKSPLHRMLQDAEVGARHALLSPAISGEIYGKALLGVPTDVTLVL
jgi:alkylation response protein AidB-like acyl-CoA dehydrogenase